MNLDYKESLRNCEPKTLESSDFCATESEKTSEFGPKESLETRGPRLLAYLE